MPRRTSFILRFRCCVSKSTLCAIYLHDSSFLCPANSIFSCISFAQQMHCELMLPPDKKDTTAPLIRNASAISARLAIKLISLFCQAIAMALANIYRDIIVL